MTQRRLIAAGVCVLAAVVCVLSVAKMAERVRDFNATAAFRFYQFKPISGRTFTAFGREASVTDVPGEGGGQQEDGHDWHVRLDYGDESVLIPVEKPPIEHAPDLSIYDEWFAVVAFVRMVPEGEGNEKTLVPEARRDAAHADDGGAAGAEGVDEVGGEGERVVAMTRVPPPGYDPATWGAVKRSEWSFRFYELKRDGTIERTLRRWPRSERSEKTLAKTAAGERGTPAEQAVAKMLAAIPPLEERSLEYQLALNVIPKLNVPSYKFKKTAMEAMGWTLPTAFFSMLVAILSLFIAIAPKTTPPAA